MAQTNATEIVGVDLRKLLEEADIVQHATLLPGDIVYVPPGYIGKWNRVFQHIDIMVSPIARIVGSIATVVVLDNTGAGG